MSLARLQAALRDLGSVAIAYSGGVDSALLARVARDVLGEASVRLVFARHLAIPDADVELARGGARELRLPLVLRDLDLSGSRAFMTNGGARCAVCKGAIFAAADRVRREHGLAWVADGTLVGELEPLARPGVLAARRHGVRHPLAEAGLTKSDVRRLARELGVAAASVPSGTCLATRMPGGSTLTSEILGRVERLEAAARAAGLSLVRARGVRLADGWGVRLEVLPGERGLAVLRADVLVAVAREVGFAWVAVDLCGYHASGEAV